jgi:hypothetical protein
MPEPKQPEDIQTESPNAYLKGLPGWLYQRYDPNNICSALCLLNTTTATFAITANYATAIISFYLHTTHTHTRTLLHAHSQRL